MTQNLRIIYNISSRGNLRGAAAKRFFRPTIAQFFTSKPFNYINSNLAPIANTDGTSVSENTSVLINLLINDVDSPRDRLTITNLTVPLHGTLINNEDGTVIYTPTSGYFGDDSFEYTVSDGSVADITTLIANATCLISVIELLATSSVEVIIPNMAQSDEIIIDHAGNQFSTKSIGIQELSGTDWINYSSINFTTEINYIQENATNTDITEGIVKLHNFSAAGTTNHATADKPHTQSTGSAINMTSLIQYNNWNTGHVPIGSAWARIDFGSPRRITRFGMKMYDYTSVMFFPNSFVLQGSDNGSSWTTIMSKTTSDVYLSIQYWTMDATYRYFKLIPGESDATHPTYGQYTVIDKWYFEGPNDIAYPINTPSYVTTSNATALNLTNVDKINSTTITASTPTYTSIKGLVSFDGRSSWKKWNGSSWVSYTLANLQSGNTTDQIQTGLTNLNITSETQLDFAFDLLTTNASVTPYVTQVTVNYNENKKYVVMPLNNYLIEAIGFEQTKITKLSTGIEESVKITITTN